MPNLFNLRCKLQQASQFTYQPKTFKKYTGTTMKKLCHYHDKQFKGMYNGTANLFSLSIIHCNNLINKGQKKFYVVHEMQKMDP